MFCRFLCFSLVYCLVAFLIGWTKKYIFALFSRGYSRSLLPYTYRTSVDSEKDFRKKAFFPLRINH